MTEAIATAKDTVEKFQVEVSDIQKNCGSILVSNPQEHERAVAFLARISKSLKETEQARKFFIDPLNAQVKAINARFKVITQPLELIDSDIREKIKNYLRKQEEERLAEERKRQQQRENEIKEARAFGAAAPPPARSLSVPEAPKTVVTVDGSSTAAKEWDFNVVDIKAVPWEYLKVEPRRKDILDAIRSGKTIPGIEAFQDYNIRVKA